MSVVPCRAAGVYANGLACTSVACAGDTRVVKVARSPARQGGPPVLVLTRKSNQSIMIGDEIEVSVVEVTDLYDQTPGPTAGDAIPRASEQAAQ